MGGCCSSRGAGEDQPYAKGGDKDISSGPRPNRGCTDVPCLIIYFAFWGLFIFVTFLGFADGNPAKLYSPRDYKGDYCGIEKAGQWNDGMDLKDQVKRTYTMNVTETVDLIAKQLVCSSAAESEFTTKQLLTSSELATYRCACCKDACPSCSGSLPIDDISTSSALKGTISGKMGELTGTGASSAGTLFSANSANGDFISNVWKEATKYFNAVCLPKCSTPHENVTASSRNYTYSPDFDAPWKRAWDVLSTNALVDSSIRTMVHTQFTFKALPVSVCPYKADKCIPFPGVSFKELASDYCTFEMATEVVDAIGASASQAYNELGANELVASMESSFGEAVGDFMNTLDAFAVTCVLSLVIGLIFLVLLRFFVGCIVWFAIAAVLVALLAGGGLMYIRSSQCNGAGLFESGENMGKNAVVAAGAAASGGTSSEEMTGNGKDYRGKQQMTQSGKTCQRWDAQSPHKHSYTPASYNNSGLTENYCRNPGSAPTIWCVTTDPDKQWELCDPIGVVRPNCAQGYVVTSETFRQILEVCAYSMWVCAFLWLVLVLCLCSRIRLAIGINKVAAQFVHNTKTIVLVPLVQIIIGITWFLIWALCASFLLSQVPEGYIPTGAFASHAVAVGTEDTPGKCTDKPTAGFAWKYEGDITSTNDPCSGNLGDTSNLATINCWKCAPPRYAFDFRFGVSLFAYLWNAALLIAVGQCTIAGAVGVWFFAMHTEKIRTKAVRTGLWNSLRFHLGSLALGAFILALVQFIRYFCKYLEKQAKAQKNKVMVMVLKVLQCCLWCIEKCIKFLNKNAYIQVALLGKNFCVSAKNAFFLITRNFARFGVVASLGSILHFMGNVFITGSTGACGYFILQALHPEVTPVIPLCAYVAVGYLVACLYMNVFGLAVDSVLHCFLATEEMGGEVNKEEFVPKPLMSFLEACESKESEKKAWM